VSHFDKTRVEEKDIRSVKSNLFSCPFPFNDTSESIWVPVLVHVYSKI